ncbi:MAG: sigma-70 family RNA polymerase sigma factor [Polyangiales bacterium]
MPPDLDTHRPLLFGLAYRMTGSVSEAEDVVQETFVRALATPPADPTRPLRPWLVRVACNVARDRLRVRKRHAYDGSWLPEALEASERTSDGPFDAEHPEARYGRRESVTVAFLVALEALSPMQRSVLLLRDVLGHSVAEAASCLGRTETYVKVAHHRARERLEGYDAERLLVDDAAIERTRKALEAFVTALALDDVDAMIRLLRADVVTTNDGGGEYLAARKPVLGRDKTIVFHRNIRRPGVPFVYREAEINGLPALVVTFAPSDPKLATRFVLQVDCAADGAIRAIRSILATAKLAHLDFPVLG